MGETAFAGTPIEAELHRQVRRGQERELLWTGGGGGTCCHTRTMAGGCDAVARLPSSNGSRLRVREKSHVVHRACLLAASLLGGLLHVHVLLVNEPHDELNPC